MDAKNNKTVAALMLLRTYRRQLTPQQYKTLCGQVRAGDADGAERGLNKLLRRKAERP